MVYFDHNATTPLLPEARQAWLEAADQLAGNPSSPHRLGSRAGAALQRAREQVARCLGCDALDLVWTSGATEANNMVFHHLARTLPADAEVCVSSLEHPCVLAAAELYFSGRCRRIPALRSGVADLDWLRREVGRKPPALIALMAANNETGVLQPWREALALCREWEIPFFCDAAQWIGKLDSTEFGACDFLSGCAHKFGGPKGVGLLKCPSRGRFFPLLVGGPQEEGRRAGTENVPGVLAMSAALGACEGLRRGNAERTQWRDDFAVALRERLPGSEILGAGERRLWNTVSALMPEADCQQRWVVKLDKAGFAVSTGSACASGKEEASHVLKAMGYGERDAGRVLRFSSGWNTTAPDWQALLEALVEVRAGMKLLAD